MRRALWLALVAAAACGAQEIDVKAIADKFEKVGQWRLPPEPDYPIYDPFRRAEPLLRKKTNPPVRKARPSVPKVAAILDDKAYVNGRWVAAGETVAGYRVTAVGRDGVYLEKGGRTLFVALKRKRGLLKIKDTKR